MTIGLTWRRTARRIKRLKETVLAISPDYSIARPPTFWRSLIWAGLREGVKGKGILPAYAQEVVERIAKKRLA
jgi:hypothetical protein